MIKKIRRISLNIRNFRAAYYEIDFLSKPLSVLIPYIQELGTDPFLAGQMEYAFE